MTRLERKQRTAELLAIIQQQRLDISACHRDWIATVAPWDRGWNRLVSLRSWAAVCGSIMAIWGIRHPRFLMRWTKRGVGVWGTWRTVRKLVNRYR